MNRFFKPHLILLAMAAAYFSMAAVILTIGEQCYDWARRSFCEYPCQHGCDLALGMLEHGAFVSASLPDQIFTEWPPLYAFFVFPFLTPSYPTSGSHCAHVRARACVHARARCGRAGVCMLG